MGARNQATESTTQIPSVHMVPWGKRMDGGSVGSAAGYHGIMCVSQAWPPENPHPSSGLSLGDSQK